MDQKNYEVDRNIHPYNLIKMTSTPVHQEPLLPPFAPPQNPENVTRSQSGSKDDFNVPSNAGLTPLYLASEAGDQDVVYQLLNDGVDPSFKELNGRTALHVASSNGWVEVVKILLEAGAVATSQTEDGWTPLHFASENGNLDVVNNLLEAGTDIRARTNDKWTALHIAALNGHVAVVGQLLQDGAEVNATTTGRITPLYCAFRHLQVIHQLLAAGADAVIADSNGRTVLHMAIMAGKIEVAKCLLRQSTSEINDEKNREKDRLQDTTGGSASHFKPLENEYRMNEDISFIAERLRLCQYLTNLYPEDYVYNRSLGNAYLAAKMYSSAASYFDIATTLHPVNAKIYRTEDIFHESLCDNCKDEIRGYRHRCTECEDYDLCHKCIGQSSDSHPNHKFLVIPSHLWWNRHVRHRIAIENHIRNANDWTPLHLASESGELEVVNSLLERGNDVRVQDELGYSALHLASRKGHLDVVNILLRANGDLDARTRDCLTPLHVAAMNGHLDVVTALMESGADVEARMILGWSALDIALMFEHASVVRAIVPAMSEISSTFAEAGCTTHESRDGSQSADHNYFPESRYIQRLVENPELIDLTLTGSCTSEAEQAMVLMAVSCALNKRFDQAGSVEDLSRAIAMAKKAFLLLPSDHQYYPAYAAVLWGLLIVRYEALGSPNDLDEAVAYIQKSLDTTLQDDPSRIERLCGLGHVLRLNFLRTGSLRDLNKSIEVINSALQDSITRDDDSARNGALWNLGSSLFLLFSQSGSLDHLNQALAAAETAVESVSQTDPLREEYRLTLSGMLIAQFNCTGGTNHLDRAISMLQEVVKSSNDVMANSNLCIALCLRFEVSRTSADLESAVAMMQPLLEAVARGHPNGPMILFQLSGVFLHRFEITDLMEDLDRATELGQSALKLIDPYNPVSSELILTFCSIQLKRFQTVGDIGDLEQAGQLALSVMNSTAAEHSVRGPLLSVLSAIFSTHSQYSGVLFELDLAIQMGLDAVQLNFHTSRNRVGRDFANLAIALFLRGTTLNSLDDIVEAIEDGATFIRCNAIRRRKTSRFREYTGYLVTMPYGTHSQCCQRASRDFGSPSRARAEPSLSLEVNEPSRAYISQLDLKPSRAEPMSRLGSGLGELGSLGSVKCNEF